MAFKPNYNHQRAERNRAKEQKKLEKRQRRDEEAARRKGPIDDPQADEHQPDDLQTEDTGETSPANPPETANGPQEATH